MTRGELLEKYQRQRAEAVELGTIVPAEKVFQVFQIVPIGNEEFL